MVVGSDIAHHVLYVLPLAIIMPLVHLYPAQVETSGEFPRLGDVPVRLLLILNL